MTLLRLQGNDMTASISMARLTYVCDMTAICVKLTETDTCDWYMCQITTDICVKETDRCD